MSLEYTHTITNSCGDELIEIQCDERGVRVCEAGNSGRGVALEREQYDALVAAVMKYDAMRQIAEAPNA